MNFVGKNKNKVVRKTKDHGPMHRVVYGRIIFTNKKPTLSKKSVPKGKKRPFQKLDEDSTSNRKA